MMMAMLMLLIVQDVCPEQEQYGRDGGSISSFHYPSVYANNANCRYYITEDEGMYASLNFNAFNVEQNYDNVHVYNGLEEMSVNLIDT